MIYYWLKGEVGSFYETAYRKNFVLHYHSRLTSYLLTESFGRMAVNLNPVKLMRTLRPVMFLSQLTGITFPPNTYKKRIRLIITYRVIVLSLIILALLKEIPTMMFWSRNLTGVHGMLAFIETRLRWSVVFTNFLLTIFNNANINKSLTKLIRNPLILKQNEYNRILKYEIFVLSSTTFLIISYMTLGHDVLWLNPYYAWYTSTIYMITEFYIGFSNLQFIILLIVIKKYFKALNENLKKCDFTPEKVEKRESFAFFIVSGHKQDSIAEIVKFRQLHMSLTSACWKTNQCFSLQILLFLIVSLVEVTYSLRAITIYSIKSNNADTNNWKSKPTLEALLICTWGGYYIWSILQIIFACETTIVESNKTSGVVHDLLNKIHEKEIQEQIFSLQLMNYKVLFSAGKFVTLNFALLNSILGTITTYLVIIMSFSD